MSDVATFVAALAGYGGIVVLRATLVLACALGIAALLARTSAAARHAHWTATLAVLFALPVLP